MKSFISVIGMYKYDNTLFNLFELPSSMEFVKENIINAICLETQELEVLYPSTQTLQFAIGVWSNAMKPIWEKLYATTKLDYNPIENYNKTETVTENEKRNDDLSSSTESNSNSENINQNVAFNNQDFSNNEKNMLNTDNQITGSETNKYNTDRTLETKTSGNIGVTTSQQMIEQERKISEFSIVQYIVDDFKERFCLMIY